MTDITDDRNPDLEALFRAQPVEADDDFTAAVEAGIDRRRRRVLAGRIVLVLLAAAVELLLDSPLMHTLGSMSEILSYPIIPLGGGWLAMLFAPLNSIAGIVGLIVLLVGVLYRKFVF